MMLSTTVLAQDHWEGPGPWWPLIPLFWLVLVALAVVAFGVVGRRRAGRGPGWGGPPAASFAAESRLGERYAAGEIDEAEYRERLAVLREMDR